MTNEFNESILEQLMRELTQHPEYNYEHVTSSYRMWQMVTQRIEDLHKKQEPGKYAYHAVRCQYKVPAEVGRRIKFQGKPGIIVKPDLTDSYLQVKFDDGHIGKLHPTWEVEYLNTIWTNKEIPSVEHETGPEKSQVHNEQVKQPEAE